MIVNKVKCQNKINLKFLILSLLVFNFSQAQNIDCERFQTLEQVVSINNEIDRLILDFIKNKDDKCSNSDFYYYINFSNENRFYISRGFEDYNNFIETCHAYIIIDKKYVLIKRGTYWQDFFISTGRYKSFSYCKTFNEFFFPFGYQSDSYYYKIYNNEIIFERMTCCDE